MSVKFTTFGGLSMLIERSDGFRILVDPYITNNPQTDVPLESLYDVDLILVSHVAFDHFGDAPAIFSHGHAKMLCDRTSYKKMFDLGLADPERLRCVGYGGKLEYGITTVRIMRAYHSSCMRNADESFFWAPPLGFMIMVEPGVTYYAPGDTSSYGDMQLMGQLYHPNVMSCGISTVKVGAGVEKDAREAALEIMWLGADVVFPGHYLDGSPDYPAFLETMKSINPRVQIISERNKTFLYTPYSMMAEREE